MIICQVEDSVINIIFAFEQSNGGCISINLGTLHDLFDFILTLQKNYLNYSFSLEVSHHESYKESSCPYLMLA